MVYGQVSRWLIHDLRNPSQALTLITGLMDDELAPAEDPLKANIRDATGHLVQSLELLDRILRIPRRPLEPGPLSLRDLLEFLAALHKARRSPVVLEFDSALHQSLPAVTGIEEELEHALLNVVMNGLEACGDRVGGHLTLTATAEEGRVLLVVTDNGPGVSTEIKSRLFEPFATTKTERAFAGLGLAVARELLSRSGGSLEYKSRKPRGSSFLLTLQTWR